MTRNSLPPMAAKVSTITGSPHGPNSPITPSALWRAPIRRSPPICRCSRTTWPCGYQTSIFPISSRSYRCTGNPASTSCSSSYSRDFEALNLGEGYGRLRALGPDERPHPRDVVLYEALPNTLPRVAGIITTVRQTPLAHVNLRAIQDSVPNAFIRDALDDPTIKNLIGKYVRYTVTQADWQLTEATPAEVAAHHAAARPPWEQTPQRDLSVTDITPLSEVGFKDWRAFGVKAANVAVLGRLGFPAGTVPDGFAIPFSFYDTFMQEAVLSEETVLGKKSAPAADKITLPADTKLIDAVEAMLAHPKFRTDFAIQDGDAGRSAGCHQGCRVSAVDHRRVDRHARDVSRGAVATLSLQHQQRRPAGLQRRRAVRLQDPVAGRDRRGRHRQIAQARCLPACGTCGPSPNGSSTASTTWRRRWGCWCIPTTPDEKVNGVAASFDPILGRVDPTRGIEGNYYVNSQVGEDLVTNPEAGSVPEEILLHLQGGGNIVLTTSNQVEPGQLLMTGAQLRQLQQHLAVIHERFKTLYDPAPGVPFAIEIEFKITSANILAIKQARPWVFPPDPRYPPSYRTARTIAGNTPAGTDIGPPVAATLADAASLTYTLGGVDAAFFAIDTNTGQLRTEGRTRPREAGPPTS